MQVNARYHSEIARLFSTRVVRELASQGSSPFLNYVLRNSGYKHINGATLTELFEDIYGFLLRNYRSEYIYKNALVSKIVLGRHSLASSSILTEFRTSNSKADLVMLNGSSVAYEIKTELDSLERLKSQMTSYLKVFDRVYVVTHSSHLMKLNNILNKEVGIILLSERYTLSTERPAISNKANTDVNEIFDCLRQREYCDIIRSTFGFVPPVPNTSLYAECRKLFSQLAPETAHDGMVKALKKRCQKTSLTSFVAAVPHSLKLSCLVSDLTQVQEESLLGTLNSSYSC